MADTNSGSLSVPEQLASKIPSDLVEQLTSVSPTLYKARQRAGLDPWVTTLQPVLTPDEKATMTEEELRAAQTITEEELRAMTVEQVTAIFEDMLASMRAELVRLTLEPDGAGIVVPPA